MGLIEALAPAWIALGFAIGAGAVALGLLTGLLGPIVALSGGYGFGVLLVVFALLSLVAWLGLRVAFGPLNAETKVFRDDIND
jgi:hypothetical protein